LLRNLSIAGSAHYRSLGCLSPEYIRTTLITTITVKRRG